MDNFENQQKTHYDKIIFDYDRHYNDKYSQKYRQIFFYGTLFSDFDWRNKKVLEAMCGSGTATDYLQKGGAFVTGLDISDKSIDIFRQRFPDSNAICSSILDSGLLSQSFDAIVIEGGLHHLHPQLSDAIKEMYRLLKPGGFLFFIEPHASSLFDRLRRFWYKRDSLFEKNEAAIDLEDLKKDFKNKFIFKKEIYLGGLAYLFVFNSMIFRIPPRLKFIYSYFLMFFDRLLKPTMNKYNSFLVLCAWQKRNS